jgi:RNA polymerase sigma factor (sigma-70 family)
MMTDAQIVMRIMQNDDRVWRYIYRNMKSGFISALKGIFVNERFSDDDMEDIFQDSSMVLMRNIKNGSYNVREGSSLFSYFVEIGKLTTFSFLRKNRPHKPAKDNETEAGPGSIIQWIPQRGDKLLRFEPGKDYLPLETEEEKQKLQDEFLERAFDSLPDTCKAIFKKFYWERKSMEEIADIIGYNTADSVKSKKSNCMKKFKDFAKKLLESDEFVEEAVRAAAERAALRELLEEEHIYAEGGMTMAALDIDDEPDKEDN